MADDNDWLAWRREGVGGSDIAAICGVPGAYGSPFTVWADKAGLLPPSEATEAQTAGKILEGAIARLFELHQPGLFVLGEQTLVTDQQAPYRRATLDGFVAESPDAAMDELLGVYEAKSFPVLNHDGTVKATVLAQGTWAMGITGLRRAYLVGLGFGKRLQVARIDWDDDTAADWAWMCERAAEFWELVVQGNPPPIDGSDHTTKALAALYPTTSVGAKVRLDSMAADIDRLEEIKHLQAAVAKLGDGAEVIENRIKALMGDAEVGTIGGEPRYVLRTTKRKGHTVPPGEFRTLRKATAKDQEKAA